MNLPNKLTILRVILIPFFVFFLISPFFDGYGNYIALAIFIIASLTDMADGKLQENTSCYKFRQVYGSACRQAACMLGNDMPC